MAWPTVPGFAAVRRRGSRSPRRRTQAQALVLTPARRGGGRPQHRQQATPPPPAPHQPWPVPVSRRAPEGASARRRGEPGRCPGKRLDVRFILYLCGAFHPQTVPERRSAGSLRATTRPSPNRHRRQPAQGLHVAANDLRLELWAAHPDLTPPSMMAEIPVLVARSHRRLPAPASGDLQMLRWGGGVPRTRRLSPD